MQNDFDVAVIGGGPAGVAAAAAAATGGGSIVLIEQSDRLGGSVTAAMHRSMCGLYSHEPSGAMDTLNGSIQRDIVRRMIEKEPQAVVPRRFGKAWVLEFPAAAWESSLGEICAEADIEQRLGRGVVAIRRDGARVSEIRLQGCGDWISARVFIDCTGGGALLRLVGEDAFWTPDESVEKTLAGFAVRLADLTGDGEMLRLRTAYAMAKAVQADTLPAIARFTVFYPGPAAGEGICKLAVEPQKSSTEEAEQLAGRIVEFLKREVSEFAGARVVEMSPRILPRAGLRLRGRYVVTEEDVLREKTRRGCGPRLVADRTVGRFAGTDVRLPADRRALRYSSRRAAR